MCACGALKTKAAGPLRCRRGQGLDGRLPVLSATHPSPIHRQHLRREPGWLCVRTAEGQAYRMRPVGGKHCLIVVESSRAASLKSSRYKWGIDLDQAVFLTPTWPLVFTTSGQTWENVAEKEGRLGQTDSNPGSVLVFSLFNGDAYTHLPGYVRNVTFSLWNKFVRN